eukprot:CAMPEP_0174279990 /NCGR_PEP_ID=MMETSP0809-20121228/276_1 /TAXON_ID=73025 ORGANISM="Eutreptiella gymnastica-like, Strain CCMP1594" /NCGR_SAMPLE_ID=MMETSP0809 /ASSEMBLY_ACC=CAM_ASM_000658 /LENGTH=131 /DNA_ID=CAMNT_0015372645 /DNA_START=333 /DNA_END=728 /DNA_ORIENTATION=+
MFFQECVMDLTRPTLTLWRWRIECHSLLLLKYELLLRDELLLDSALKLHELQRPPEDPDEPPELLSDSSSSCTESIEPAEHGMMMSCGVPTETHRPTHPDHLAPDPLQQPLHAPDRSHKNRPRHRRKSWTP